MIILFYLSVLYTNLYI